MKSIAAAASLFGVASAAGATPYTYTTNGADWGSIPGYESCNDPGGSPIDVKTDTSLY